MKFSIILRAYNAADVVSKSIESVIHQTYKNWELIIVNDGSTDNTAQIIEKYAHMDNRIRVIHQENKGCLAATQTGIGNSVGDYLCLIDADDWYDEIYLERINEILINDKADMVVAGYYIVLPNGEKKKFQLTEETMIVEPKEAMKTFLKTTNYALWNKFVAREKVFYSEEQQKHYDTFGKTTNFGDDLYLLMPVLCNCEKIYFTPECLYNYVVDDQSISHKKIKNYCEELTIRNRLMEFTYCIINNNRYMDREMKELLHIDSVVVMLPVIVESVKNRALQRVRNRELKNNTFFYEMVLKTRFVELNQRFGIKKAIVFQLFKIWFAM